MRRHRHSGLRFDPRHQSLSKRPTFTLERTGWQRVISRAPAFVQNQGAHHVFQIYLARGGGNSQPHCRSHRSPTAGYGKHPKARCDGTHRFLWHTGATPSVVRERAAGGCWRGSTKIRRPASKQPLRRGRYCSIVTGLVNVRPTHCTGHRRLSQSGHGCKWGLLYPAKPSLTNPPTGRANSQPERHSPPTGQPRQAPDIEKYHACQTSLPSICLQSRSFQNGLNPRSRDFLRALVTTHYVRFTQGNRTMMLCGVPCHRAGFHTFLPPLGRNSPVDYGATACVFDPFPETHLINPQPDMRRRVGCHDEGGSQIWRHRTWTVPSK